MSLSTNDSELVWNTSACKALKGMSSIDSVSPVRTIGADTAKLVLALMSTADSVAREPNPRLVRAVPALVRSDRLLALANLVPIELVMVVEKEASSLIAAASSFNVSSAAGALATRPATSVST